MASGCCERLGYERQERARSASDRQERARSAGSAPGACQERQELPRKAATAARSHLGTAQELPGDCPGAVQAAQELPRKVATAARSRLRIARNCLETALGRPGCPGRTPQLPGAAQRLPRLTKNCPGRPPQLSGAAQEGRRSSQERPRGTAQEGRHSCPVQSIPRSKPMTDKATKMCWPDRSSTSLSALSSRGGCREAHLDTMLHRGFS